MKIIVPMAGRGSRLRPHTLKVPKPLVSVAGQSIVNRLIKDIAKIVDQKVDEVAFIIGDPAFFGDDVVKRLTQLAESIGAKASIYRQEKPMGTGHAIMCAKESLFGPAVIAYADTLIQADFKLDETADAVIWVKKVNNPESYGVVQLNESQDIISLVEKPTKFISDLAAIGIYYFKEVGELKMELQSVIDNEITNGGEYQINDGIKNMISKGKVFKTGKVKQWMDCGNKQVTVETNALVLENDMRNGENLISKSIKMQNSIIIEPCFIDENVQLINSIVGPYTSIGKDTVVSDSVIKKTIIQHSTTIKNAILRDSMIGSHVYYDGLARDLSVGDYTTIDG